MKTAYLRFEPCENNEISEENFKRVGSNSGNIVFDYALMNTIKCEPIESGELRARAWEFDNLVVRNFIWIKEDQDMSGFRHIMEVFGDKPIIPISVGLQSQEMKVDFRIHPNTVNILCELAERAELAVRGAYTAEILSKHGVKNIRVVGCPSMYLGANYNRKVNSTYAPEDGEMKVMSNYCTLSKTLDTERDIEILEYLSNRATYFVEQNKCYFPEELRTGNFKNFMAFYRKCRKQFFVFEDWYRFALEQDFSIGARFHGNVVPVLAGIPALFLTHDSRTQEMIQHFKFPSMKMKDFDTSKPIQYYYEKADYSEFNKIYPALLDNFIEFLIGNNLEPSSGIPQYFYRRMKDTVKGE